MVFEKLCMSQTTSNPIITNENDVDIPDKYKIPVKSLIDIMKPKMNILDKVNVRFIENSFDDPDRIINKLERHTDNGEIPDSIINTLSDQLYTRKPSELNQTESAIIKVLACYICIQI